MVFWEVVLNDFCSQILYVIKRGKKKLEYTQLLELCPKERNNDGKHVGLDTDQ